MGDCAIVMPEILSQDTEKPVVGLVNLMPYTALGRTQQQWSELLGADLQIKFDDDPREESGCRSAEYLSACVPFSDVADDLDAVVVTGANLELAEPERAHHSRLLPLDQISYISKLHDVIDWSVENEKPAVYSCLASHIALNYLFGLERERGSDKTFGVYEHEVQDPGSELVHGVDNELAAPHSRWGNIPAKLLEDCGVEIVAAHEEVGWLVARYESGIFLQGHPEYGAYDLAEEFRRDASCGLKIPENYFPNDNPEAEPGFTWAHDRTTLFDNIRRLVSRN